MRLRPLPAKSLIWLAVMAPALVAIMALVANAAHAYRVYIALQRATDAACEAAAVAAVNQDVFINTGEIRLIPSRARAAASQVFVRTMAEVSVPASVALQVHQDMVFCQGSAHIPLLIRLPGLAEIPVSVKSASRARGIRR